MIEMSSSFVGILSRLTGGAFDTMQLINLMTIVVEMHVITVSMEPNTS